MQTIQFEAKKDKLNQLQDGTWKLTLTIHPEDITLLANASMGQQFMCVLAPVDGGEPAEIAQKEKREWKDLKYVEQAGILCSQHEFWDFLMLKKGNLWSDTVISLNKKGLNNADDIAAECVRSICKVQSRKELDTNSMGQSRYRELQREYLSWKEKQ